MSDRSDLTTMNIHPPEGLVVMRQASAVPKVDVRPDDDPESVRMEVTAAQPADVGGRRLLDSRRDHLGPMGNGVVVGSVVRYANGQLWVDFRGNPIDAPLTAQRVSIAGRWCVGQSVALMFQDGDLLRPIAIGPVEQLADERLSTSDSETKGETGGAAFAEAADEEITLAADKQLTLRCGDASITLTKAGKIIIRGRHILSRSAGVNRIKGGSVQIN